MTERLHFHFSLSCIGEGNGNPLQCSYLENLRDGGAWWAAVYGVAQSRTQLNRLSSSNNTPFQAEGHITRHKATPASFLKETLNLAVSLWKYASCETQDGLFQLCLFFISCVSIFCVWWVGNSEGEGEMTQEVWVRTWLFVIFKIHNRWFWLTAMDDNHKWSFFFTFIHTIIISYNYSYYNYFLVLYP